MQLYLILVDINGKPKTEKVDPAIPADIINLLHNLRNGDNLSLFDAVKAIRISLVPEGYEPYPFRSGVPECLEDMLKSIVAKYRFRNTVSKYMSEGIDFSTYLYIPQIDAESGEAFQEREDHCHILKRIWKHTREEEPPGTNLQGFDDAMLDPATGLTMAALTGERKQSVVDAERMLSYLVAKFLTEKGTQMKENTLELLQDDTRPRMVEVFLNLSDVRRTMLCSTSSWIIGCLGIKLHQVLLPI